MKNARPSQAESSAPNAGALKSTRRLTPRQRRTLFALSKGPVMREALDRIAGASNGPNIIMELRRMGLKIECERLVRLDRDGRRCRPGRYSMAQSSQGDTLSLLEAADGEWA